MGELTANSLDFYLDRPKQVVIVTPDARSEAEPLLQALRGVFLPNRVLSVIHEGRAQKQLGKLVPLVKGKTAQQGKATAYVCEQQVCELPTADPTVFVRQLKKLHPLEPPAEQAAAGG